MPDRLYLSCWIRGFSATSMLRHFGKMLELFPHSKLAKRGPVLRVYAIEHAEPPLFEREFPLGVEPDVILNAAGEFTGADCTCEVDTVWDLWQYQGDDWKLMPAAVTLFCFGPEFEHDTDDQLRIEFGIDARFLPMPDVQGGLRMGQSNLRSLLHLVGDLERGLNLDRRQLWSESGANFAEVLSQAISALHVN